MEQRTKEWYIARMGKFTSSEIAKLVGKGRAKYAVFSQTGLTYISETNCDKIIRQNLENGNINFDEWLYRINSSSRATEWGTSHEDEARALTATMLGKQIDECGFILHPTIKTWGDSSDGLIDIDGEKYPVEIKCPFNPQISYKFIEAFKVSENYAETLKEENADYYWQCVSHCICNGKDRCLFVVYDGFITPMPNAYWIVPSEEDIATLIERVELASELLK